jgi:LysM repeat protein
VPSLKKLNNLLSDELYPGQILKVFLSPEISKDLLNSPTYGPSLAETEEDLQIRFSSSLQPAIPLVKKSIRSSFLIKGRP